MPRATRATLRRWEWLALIGILFLAAVMRFWAPGVVEFKRDEAALSRLALDLAKGEAFPWLGIGSSVGFPNAPINVYILALPYWISSNPLTANIFIGFLNILAIALLWKLARRYFGAQVAVVAALLLAASPWAAIYSRKIWAQDMLPPFVILVVFTGLLGFIDRLPKRWAQMSHLPLLAITVQIHLGAISLIPLTVWLLWLGRRQLTTAMWIGVGIAGLVCLPYLYGLYDADYVSLTAVSDSLDSDETGADAELRQLSTTAFEHAWFTVAGTDIHSLAGEDQYERYLEQVPPAYPLFALLPLAAALTGVWLAYRAWRRPAMIQTTLLIWLVLPVVTFSFTWAAPQPHYMIPMMPAAFLMIALGLVTVWQWLSHHAPLLRYALATLLTLVIVLQVWLWLALLAFLGTHDTSGAFGTPLHYLLDIRQTVLDENPERLVVYAEGSSPEFDEAPAVWDILLDDLDNVLFVDGTHLWIVPAEPAAALVAPSSNRPIPTYGRNAPDRVFDLRPGEGHYRAWWQVHQQAPDNTLSPQAHFANGVVLANIWRDEDILWLVWRLPAAQRARQFIVFVHGVDATNERVVQHDIPFWWEGYWQAEDRVWLSVDLVGAAAQELRIGMYTLSPDGSYTNSEYLDTQGRYVDQWFSILRNQVPEAGPSAAPQ